jgi:hypothetical protein
VCAPTLSAERANGLLHAVAGAPSRRQATEVEFNVVNATIASVEMESTGVLVNDTEGTATTIQDVDADATREPTVLRTTKVCRPGLRRE